MGGEDHEEDRRRVSIVGAFGKHMSEKALVAVKALCNSNGSSFLAGAIRNPIPLCRSADFLD